MRILRPYQVTLQVTRDMEFVVDAVSPEEAENIAVEYVEDGETGEITETTIEALDVTPVDDAGTGEFVPELREEQD